MIDPQKRLAIFIATMVGGGAQRVRLTLAGGRAVRGIAGELVLARADGPGLAHVPESGAGLQLT